MENVWKRCALIFVFILMGFSSIKKQDYVVTDGSYWTEIYDTTVSWEYDGNIIFIPAYCMDSLALISEVDSSYAWFVTLPFDVDFNRYPDAKPIFKLYNKEWGYDLGEITLLCDSTLMLSRHDRTVNYKYHSGAINKKLFRTDK